MLTRIDHVMICVPDLAKGIEAYTRLGFNVYPGGSHTGRPTHNAIALHDEDYIELLSIRDRRIARTNALSFGSLRCERSPDTATNF